jgi:hypothetical protein
VTPVKVTAIKPADVAVEVERLLRLGCRSFVLGRVDHGGMLDLERLGAARYAAGLQSSVELEAARPVAVAGSR